jgi:TatD DNase family protein
MFDTHCHLTDPRLMEQLPGVLERAAAAGVGKIVTIGVQPGDWEAAIGVTAGRENIRCAVGAHPNHCHEIEREELARLREYVGLPVVAALGEMGLDYHHQFADRALQMEYFQLQLELARSVKLPVVIHCREAVDDCLLILAAFPDVRAVFHCFTGSMDEARRIWDAGYLTGFTGVVTFRNGQSLRDIVAEAPADRILVETDAPYLTPEPMRKQKINEPALVMHTAAVVAAARKMSLAELDELTTKNALGFYRWISRAC